MTSIQAAATLIKIRWTVKLFNGLSNNIGGNVPMTASEAINELGAALDRFKQMAIFEGYEVNSPESPGMDGDTPLHVVAMEGRVDLLRIMLPFVKNINVSGDLGNAPLHCAILWGHLEVAQLLLDQNADVLRENDYGDTPIDLMKNRPAFRSVVKKLAGANPK